jgi:hypothetical protein
MRNLYTPPVLRQVFAQADDARMQLLPAFDAAERNAIQVYVEFSGASSCKIVPWIKIRVEHPITEDPRNKQDVWVRLGETQILPATSTSHEEPPIIVGATKSTLVQLAIPNCHAYKLELTDVAGGGTVRVWSAPVEAPPAIS